MFRKDILTGCFLAHLMQKILLTWFLDIFLFHFSIFSSEIFFFFFSKSLSPDCLQAKKILLKLQIILNSKYPLMSQNQESLHRNWYLEGTREFHFIFFNHSQVFLCHAEEMGKKSASSLYCFKSSGSYNKSCHVLL